VRQRGAQTLVCCLPIGTHPRMTEVVAARAAEVVEKFPFPGAPDPKDITLFIAGHGTEQNENSRKAIERQVQLLREQRLYANVHGVFLEEEPRIGDCYPMADTRNIVVVPFFISDGLHTQQDIPVLLGEPKDTVRQRCQNNRPPWRNPTERKGKRVWYAASVGTDPHIADVIVDRVREAAGSL
jgi:sirohydrochlorin cobaltochelatase